VANRPAGVSAGEDVLGHGQVLEHGRLLVHRDDAQPARRLRISDPLRLTADQQPTLVGVDDAGEDLDERRLAGTVLADERVDAPGTDDEAHVLERVHAAVALRDAFDLEERRGRSFAHRGYAAGTPPSTLRTQPVVLLERSPARNATASATSSG